MSGGRGASLRVQAALGWKGVAGETMKIQVASCVQCGAGLRFTTGDYGQTLEICENRNCPGSRPHRPQPDPNADKPKRTKAELASDKRARRG